MPVLSRRASGLFWLGINGEADFDLRFLEAIGYGKQEREWLTEYDRFPVRDGFRSDWMIVGRSRQLIQGAVNIIFSSDVPVLRSIM